MVVWLFGRWADLDEDHEMEAEMLEVVPSEPTVGFAGTRDLLLGVLLRSS